MPAFNANQRGIYAWPLAGYFFAGAMLGFFLFFVPLLVWDEFKQPPAGGEKITFGEALIILFVLTAVFGLMLSLGGLVVSMLLPARIVGKKFAVLAVGLGLVGFFIELMLTYTVPGTAIDRRLLLFVVPVGLGAVLAWAARWLGLWMGLLSLTPGGEGHCEACGYDLRMLGEAGACPECGAAFGGPGARPDAEKPPEGTAERGKSSD